MTRTTNLNLKKPGQGDYINIQDLNDNADLLDAAFADQESQIGTLEQEAFENLYMLCTKNTVIETVDGNRRITETGDGVTAVGTITKTSDTVTTVTTVVTPDEGDYYYTKSMVVTKTESGRTISESYTRAEKEE